MLNDPVLLNDWHVVAYAPALPERQPVAARLLDEDLVLWKVDGRVHVWRDLCVHRGARLSLGRVEDGCLICPYHGWTYDEEGHCVRFPAHPEQKPPATAHARVYRSCLRYDWVWVTLGEPQHEVPAFPEWDDASFRKVHTGPYSIETSGPRAIENFLDVAHFPYVHAGLLGDPAHAAINDYTVETGEDGITARDITVWQPNPDGSGQGAEVTYTYRVLRPLTAYFVKTSQGPRFAMFFTVTPVSERRCIAWQYVALNYGEQSEEEIRRFEDMVMQQDVRVIESQRPELLPLDLQAELHLRSDRTAIAYRRWLRRLGVTFGTA
ncbi:MAG: aromatic ring-hydroxylating dioxygenase subunit alpha [Thermogemmatispora sp.]|jgi:phenylpropionate dioxygenase-like ring-hydroxylating dioxygenase large terminal subunit|uniref:aromatic ring-hydroxylating dioxygenase subunit alpha n=1 Tax=Thermogemmatispora TaxID=768669 RepID=UPI00124F40C5|nr:MULTISPECIES: aromatic ring-hydroxylating dioxygenase subunit alpha [Thermogemmatispora]MBE3564536.1 aromatic ring-hydroxylating dioxygenase subunit alpha [Thermogemmatispora sp.]GER84232.1 chlorophyll a oxygenase [Thermogemmatispora aurantia]